MTDEQVCETVEKYGANREECARLNASLSCLRNVHTAGEQPRRSGLSTVRQASWAGPAHNRVEMVVRFGSRRDLNATLQRTARCGSWGIRVWMWESWEARVLPPSDTGKWSCPE